jgi:g-D-glutamyl-meso-diaminopimelate peptidase
MLVLVAVGYVIWHYKAQPVSIFPEKKPDVVKELVIGKSVEGRDITAYTFGQGEKHLNFIGGIHGGYEWNSVLLAYQFIDYLTANPDFIPKDLTVTVIPSVNPDGVYKVVEKEGRFTVADVKTNLPAGTGRFNTDKVDLNRNFDCNWQATSTWRSNLVSAGTSAFSEPEVMALKNFILQDKPVAAIFWHSQSNAVYASACNNGILPETLNIMTVYAQASGYPAVKTFDSYVITGDAEGWLASVNIPAITVELATHETIEWDRNLAGVKALFDYFKKPQI